MKDTRSKIVLGIAIVLLLVSVGYIIKLQFDAKKRQELLQEQVVEMKQLQDGIVRGQSKYVSKEDFKQFAKDVDLDLGVIQDDLNNFDAEIKGINSVIVASRGWKATGLGSTNTVPRPEDPNNSLPTCPDGTVCEDPYGYLANTQYLGLHERFDTKAVPLGSVSFEAWKERPWSVDLLPRKYLVATVLGQDENGRHYVHNRFQVEVDGKTHTIPVESSEYVQRLPEASFRFDPHVNLGVTVGPTIATSSPDPGDPRVRAEVQPTLDVSLFSYGQTKVSPDWRFLGLGIGYETQNNNLGIIVNPVDYNVGQHIPYMNNLSVGPTIGTDLKGQVFIGGGVRVSL